MKTVVRLKRRPDFLKVAAARKKWVAPGLIVQARLRDRAESSAAAPGATEPALLRVGFTVSRRVGNAVARNRARRRLRAAAADIFARPGFAERVRQGMDVVVIGRTETLTRDFPDLIGDLALALQRLDVWRDGGPRIETKTETDTKAAKRTKA